MTTHEESYRGFSIEVSILEKPTIWQLDVKIGTGSRDAFVLEPAIPPISRNFHGTAGAVNAGLAMIEDAKSKIDRYLESLPSVQSNRP